MLKRYKSLLKTTIIYLRGRIQLTNQLKLFEKKGIWPLDFGSQLVHSECAAFADGLVAGKENNYGWGYKNSMLRCQFGQLIRLDKNHFHFWERLENHVDDLGFQNMAYRTCFRREISQNGIILGQNQIKFRN